MSTIALTKRWLERHGWQCSIVEQTVRAPGMVFKRDAFGCIDILAVHPDRPGVTGVQATSRSNLSTRLKKAESVLPPAWLAAGNDFIVFGWFKSGGRHRFACEYLSV